MKPKLAKADAFFWPMALIAALAMLVLLGAVFTLVHRFDTAAREREETVVANGITGRIAEVQHRVVPEAVWDDAVRHLDNSYDAEWARDNIGEYFSETDGFEASFVLDPADRPLFADIDGDVVAASSYAAYAPHARAIVAAVREGEYRRPPLSQSLREGQINADPIQASTIAWVEGRLFILSATLVQPDFGRVMPKGRRAPIVVTGMLMEGPFLQAFAERFMLDGAHIQAADHARLPSEARMLLLDDSGAAIAALTWRPQAPGTAMLRELIAPVLLVLMLLGGATLMLVRRSRRMAQGLIASEARAHHLAYFDALTGLPNRVLFFDRLGVALDQLRRGGPTIAVHCIDLDRFKEVNDTFGHQVGDELIQEAAKRMSAQCRSSDTFCRLSGDEFAIVQTNATAQSAAAMAARLVQIMSEPVEISDIRLFVGCSVGVSMVAEAGADAAEALRQADLALYRAKENGRGQFCFFEIEMDAAVKTRRALETDLREALRANQLEMVYQPQVNGRNVITGVEALVRWRHPVRGYISPAFFVPIAEECGLIAELGMFTLRRAFEDSLRWPGLKVAINVSATQVRMKDFMPRLIALVDEMDIDPRRFELEITEGILLGDDPDTHETLKRIRNLGFALALDDFGTGYSSLSYLQRYPITKIKIDRSFISNLGVDSESEAVVGAIVKLARALNLNVIAEGVETHDQRERLAASGCTEIQGFLFSKPVTPEEIDRMTERAAPIVQVA